MIMANKELSSKEVEDLTRASLPLPSEDMVGKYYKIPYDVVVEPAPDVPVKSWKQGVFKLTEKMEWIFIGIGLIQPA